MKKLLLIPTINLVFLIFGFPQISAQNYSGLENNFRTPPASSHPYVWWHWMGNNITAEGITSDLEAMKDAGIAGATIFNISTNADKGGFFKNSYTRGITYHNAEWWKLVKHAAAEADRLGIEIGIHNCVGYTGSGGPWITPEKSMQKVVWTTVRGPMPYTAILPQPETTLGYYRDIAVLAVPDRDPSPDKIIDITLLMEPDGTLNWDVPQGAWTVYRFGHTSTGKRLRPVPEDLNGMTLEADKLSPEAMSFHMHQVLDPLKENLGSYVGRSFKHILFDSFESEEQNWTPKMREEFIKRRGYDIIPWLPVLAGCDIGGKEKASRFLWDLETTISEMLVENAFLLPKTMINKMGLQTHMEPYGGPVDELYAASAADILMVEFWINRRPTYGGKGLTGSAGRALGKKILAAEAFTGDPSVSQWTETPASLKAAGDSAFAYGINRMVLHHWTHQPFPDNIKPGMCFGWWGTHFGRNQTWFEPGKAWITYLSRCQSLLQLGDQVADFCVLEKENPGSGGDAVSTNMFLDDLSVVNGKIVLTSGRSYSLLVIPERNTMIPAVARKLKQLVAEGAVVKGPRPEKSQGLQDWPDADKEVNAIGKEVWGNTDGISVKENKFGKGRIIWGRQVADVLSEMGLAPDVKLSGSNTGDIRWNHRRDGRNDYYFIVNPENRPAHFKATVRIEGKIPEFWYPETGEIEVAGIWQNMKGFTDVDVRLKSNESVFLVFRRPSGRIDAVSTITTAIPDSLFKVTRIPNGNILIRSLAAGKFTVEMVSGRKHSVEIKEIPQPVEIKGNWKVSFQPVTGSPVSGTFDHLASWTESADEEIKYFSGTAKYRNEFIIPGNILTTGFRVILDLGLVKEIADVRINGKQAGILWHAPFITDITRYLKPGVNIIEIDVTNTWVNRLIGDEQFPEDCNWGGFFRVGCSLIEFPQWLINNQQRPSKERSTFATWNYFTRESPLPESGLIGPVFLLFEGVKQAK